MIMMIISLVSDTWRDDALALKIVQKAGIITIDNENAYQMLSQNVQTLSSEVLQLRSALEETDVRVVLYAKYALDQLPYIPWLLIFSSFM